MKKISIKNILKVLIVREDILKISILKKLKYIQIVF